MDESLPEPRGESHPQPATRPAGQRRGPAPVEGAPPLPAQASGPPGGEVNLVATPAPAPVARPVDLLAELVNLTRESLRTTRAILDLNLRWEQRMQEQQQGQREEFAQLLRDQPQLRGRSRRMAELTRGALGRAVSDLFDFLDESGDGLAESEFVAREMGDRFGHLLGQISSTHSLLRRLASVDRPDGGRPGEKGAGGEESGKRE